MESRKFFQLLWIFLALAIVPIDGKSAQAQVPVDTPIPLEPEGKPLTIYSPPDLRLNFTSLIEGSPNSGFRPDRFAFFRMPAGFLNSPIGLDSDDDEPANNSESQAGPTSGDDRLQVLLGQDNPFFDFRYRGDPGGPGYYRLHAQYQLLDSNTSGLCLGLRAVTPAGLESEGVAQGRTILTPALAWYQDLGCNFILHGFVGKNVHAASNWTDNIERSLNYGLAVQQPLPGLTPTPNCSVHMFVEALGRQRSNPDLVARPSSTFEMLPGLHWQLGENWWMQGGLLLPMGTSHLDSNLWQITCSWRF
jgi:hypothetical protein